MTELIRLEAVRKGFRMGDALTPVLEGIDLVIREGEFVAIMGPSGSGKTTCLEILGAISRPSEGRYWFDGRAIEALGDRELADLRVRSMGFVFQSFNLMPRMSALRNVALPLVYAGVGRAERERRAQSLLERLGLGHRLQHGPAQLSGGERQRVAIARALVNEPRLILADEPTGNLDQATGKEILDVFDGLHSEGRTLVVVTHAEDVARRAGRIVRVLDGRIVDDVRNA
jgi:putative ABC transport system ATP-binding protein